MKKEFFPYTTRRLIAGRDRLILLDEPSFLRDEHINHLLSQIVRNVLSEMKISCCGIWLADKKGSFIPRMIFGVKEELYAMTHSKRFGRLLQCVTRRRKHVIIRDMTKLKDEKFIYAIRRENLKSLLAYPLFTNGIIVGILVICARKNEGTFTGPRIGLGRVIAENVSLELKNLYLYKKSRTPLDIIKILATLTETKDKYTEGHSKKVMEYCMMICNKRKLSNHDIAIIKEAALLHDLGKIIIDKSILNKKSPLTKAEWREIKKHPSIGAKIVSKSGLHPEVAPIIMHHHEKFGGGGYPQPHLKYYNIPLGSRIIAVADAYDAMSSDRAYRKAMDKKVIIDELYHHTGIQFDPQIVRVFADFIPD